MRWRVKMAQEAVGTAVAGTEEGRAAHAIRAETCARAAGGANSVARRKSAFFAPAMPTPHTKRNSRKEYRPGAKKEPMPPTLPTRSATMIVGRRPRWSETCAHGSTPTA